MSNFDITELLTDRQMDERTDEWKSGHAKSGGQGVLSWLFSHVVD